ncbi:MAG: glycosyltransferase family 39 protein, partial [Chthoniobacterales bacterium]
MTSANDRKLTLLDVSWLLFFGAASAWWCVTAAYALSATFDEPTYLQLGLEHWCTWATKPLMRLGTLPLAIDLQTLPLFLWEKWRGVPIDPVSDLPWALPWTRIVTLAFWWTLLVYAWRAGRALAGPWAGRLAVAILACEPVFLAHASLATTDVAVTACLLVFFFEFRAHRDRRWPWRIALPALLYAIAMLAKASTLIFGGLGMLAIEIERVVARGDLKAWRDYVPAGRTFLRDVCAIVAGGLTLTFLYCWSEWSREASFTKWAQTLAPGFAHDSMLWLSEHLRIFSNAGEGLVQQIKHNIRGHGAFLLGQEYRRAIWYYFPVALSIKTSLPLLLLPLVLALIRPRALWNWACLAALALLVFSLNSRVQIGVRLMLPLLACLAVGGAAAFVQVHRSLGKRFRIILVACMIVGLLGNAAAAIRVWPEALCYTNPAWGGTRGGYRLLSDSNYD